MLDFKASKDLLTFGAGDGGAVVVVKCIKGLQV